MPDPVADPTLATFTAAELAELAAFGTERAVEAGDVLFRAGDASYDFVVVLEGEVEVVRPDPDGAVSLARHTAGRFVGELSLLTGQRPYLTARVITAGRVLDIAPDEFRRLMATKPAIADTIFGALAARRERLRSGPGADAIRIVGSRFSAEALALRVFAERSRFPFHWVDLEDADDAAVVLAGMGLRPRDTPVVLTPMGVLRRPTPGSSLPTSDSRSDRRPASCSTSWSWVRVLPDSPRPSTARPRACRPCRSMPWRRADRQEPARGSRTTSASRTVSRVRISHRARRSRRSASVRG